MTATAESCREDRASTTRRLLETAQDATDEERAHLHEEVVTLNLGAARSVARRFINRGETYEDLLQVAYLGLTKAVRGFDPTRGHDLLSYAVPTMSGEIKRHFRDLCWVVRPPRSIQELQPQISRAASELSQSLHRTPRPSELADHLGVNADDVVEALATDGCFNPGSLDHTADVPHFSRGLSR